MLKLAAVGVGLRLSGMIAAMAKQDPELRLTLVVDPDEQGVRQRLARHNIPTDNLRIFPSIEPLLQEAGQIDGLAIGTRCHLHTPMAVHVASLGKPLFLEKPVAISFEQLHDLARAYKGRENQVLVSFPLRVTAVCKLAIEMVQSGILGTINQIQAVNNVTYGGVYFGTWYRNWNQVGGLWLQKATHDFDYLNCLVGCRPMRVAAMMTRRVYGGDMPHDLTCDRCDKQDTCYESPKQLKARNDGGGMGVDNHDCPFSRDIRNQDAGSALLWYENGILVSYDQNFIARKDAGRRGAIILGQKGTIEFDWKAPETLRHIDHTSNKVTLHRCAGVGGHGGGDGVLQRNFLDMMRQKAQPAADLRTGLQSVAMCLAARQSARQATFQTIEDFGSLPTATPHNALVEV